MLKRISNVQHIKTNILSFSGQLQIGDSNHITTHSKALAVQREHEILYGSEGNFKVYPIFNKKVFFPPIAESLTMTINNPVCKIHVNKINILAISNASILQIGSNQTIYGESRIKHIRQLTEKNRKSPTP